MDDDSAEDTGGARGGRESSETPVCGVVEAPAPGRVIQLHKGNVDYGTPWELEDVSGTVGKLSASCFEVVGCRSKS